MIYAELEVAHTQFISFHRPLFLLTCTLLKSMSRAVNGSVRDLYPPGSLLSLSVVYGSMESSGSELQLTGLWSSPAADMDRLPTSDTQSLHEKYQGYNRDLTTGPDNFLCLSQNNFQELRM